MYRSKRIVILLAVLAVCCVAAFAALQVQERQERIETSGEVVLEIDSDAVQTLSWTYEGETLSFHRDGDWLYDGDETFPVDGEKVGELLETFQSFAAAFVIEEVEDPSQYGLDDPVCTITLGTGENNYEILLGDFSAMDSQRYVSIGDGKVYLAASDPLDQFDAGLRDMIDHDDIPELDQVTRLRFDGVENYTVTYEEDNSASWCEEDIYFTQRDGKTLPLDTGRVEDYLHNISYLSPNNYVTYHATEEELASYGLDEPELTVTVDYTAEDRAEEKASGTLILHISRDPEERLAAQEAADTGETEEEETITAYLRVGDSQIVYQITSEDYQELMAASYDDLRHQEVLSADFGDIRQIEVTLEGASHTLTAQGEGEDRTWLYQGEEVDISAFQEALESLSADSFTDERPSQRQEIALTVYLDNDAFPQVAVELYRWDGEHCLAVVDGEPVSLVARSGAVDIIEAVQAIVLN